MASEVVGRSLTDLGGGTSASYDVVVLGGGFAGLSCAVALTRAGARVTLLEKKPHLGGRAYSFRDGAGGVVDNGQHLFMGCYAHTRRFLRDIGSAGLLRLLPEIRVDFAEAGGARDSLRCPAVLGAPLHLAWGILGLNGLTLRDKMGLVKFGRALAAFRRNASSTELDRMTVRHWLDALGQSQRIQSRLFDPIALGALNDDPSVAAATGFAQAMSGMFFGSVDDSRLGLSSVGLSELYTEQARAVIEAGGGRVILSRKAASIDGKSVTVEGGERFQGEAVVSTLPPWDLKRLTRPEALSGDWERLKAAPIVSLCLWLDRPVLSEDEKLVGMLGTDIQWVFNKTAIFARDRGPGQYLSLVISGAHKHVSWDPKALLELATRDLGACFPVFRKAKIERWKAVKEPFATLSPVPGSEAVRPTTRTAVPGLFLAGDWTRTDLPATIESAVKSGHKAAEAILKA